MAETDEKAGNEETVETTEMADIPENIKEEVSPSKENIINIQELAEQYKQEYSPRPFYIQILITLGFVFGPIFLLIDPFPESFLDGFGLSVRVVSGAITVVFFLSILIRALQESRKYS